MNTTFYYEFLVHMTLLRWDIFLKTSATFFSSLHVFCKSIANEHSLFDKEHFLGAMTCFSLQDTTLISALVSCSSATLQKNFAADLPRLIELTIHYAGDSISGMFCK